MHSEPQQIKCNSLQLWLVFAHPRSLDREGSLDLLGSLRVAQPPPGPTNSELEQPED